jgi:galactose mutarotase-like enzyme
MNIKISNDKLTASINTMGAELFSLQDSKGREYMWEGNPEFWGKHSPVLFPIVGTLKNNSYSYKGINYTMSRHGFARDNKFTVVEKNDNSVTFGLKANGDTLKVYPFDFELHITYKINSAELSVSYAIINHGEQVMPFSIGAHPAFALPGSFEDYSLEFEKDEELVSTPLENDLLSDKEVKVPRQNAVLSLSYDLFKNDALIFKTLQSKSITINKTGIPFIKVNYKDFPHLGIWTKVNAPFICIEPWHGYSDRLDSKVDLPDKEGVVNLASGAVQNFIFNIEILS